MKKLSRLEVFLSSKLNRRVAVKAGMAVNPGKRIREEAIEIFVPKHRWEFGSCRRALLHSVSGELILITKKISGRQP